MTREPDPTARMRENEVEVPGTPEEVWQAIATGPGHAAWVFPAEIEPEEGGSMLIRREPYGTDQNATVTAWEPPKRFAYEEPVGPDGKPLTVEFLVEAKRGGSCVVRVVCGFRHDGEGWEDLVEGASEGWRMTLVVLRAYLTHFAARPVAQVDVIVDLGLPASERARASAGLAELLGLNGGSFRMPAGAPALTGTVEHHSEGYVLLRAVEPHPGLYAISCFPMYDGAPLSLNLLARLYGTSSGVAEKEQAKWESWLVENRRSFDQ